MHPHDNVARMAPTILSQFSKMMFNIQMTLVALLFIVLINITSTDQQHRSYSHEKSSNYLVSASELYSSPQSPQFVTLNNNDQQQQQQQRNTFNQQHQNNQQQFNNNYNYHSNQYLSSDVDHIKTAQHERQSQHQQHHHQQQFNICSLVPSHISSQLKMCKNSQTNAIVAINNGALNGIKECQKQFNKERWNCSHPQGDHHLITGHSAHSGKLSHFFHL